MMEMKVMVILAETMFGIHWRSELAKRLKVSRAAIHKWDDREHVPADRVAELRAIFTKRSGEINRAANKYL